MPQYTRYRDDLETFDPDERQTFQKIIDLMLEGQHNVREKYGQSVRVSHAKAHGFLKGELIVNDGLPPELAQGLFARSGRYPALARLAQVPGEVLDDRTVSAPRGMSIKLFDVQGPKLPGHEPATTQDFLLSTGEAFIVDGAKAFLAAFRPNATVAPKLSEGVKGAVSHASRATNAVLSAVGLSSGKLDFYGHPPYHPLGESYYLQAPIRYGDYVAKLSVTPANAPLKALQDQKLDLTSENALRDATAEYFRANGAEYDLNVQLMTDPDKMPIEDASAKWPEELSAYRPVARLVFPPQEAFSDSRQAFVDYRMSFSPVHSLAAHRPLGSIMRARLTVYPALSQARRLENGEPIVQPDRIDQIPN